MQNCFELRSHWQLTSNIIYVHWHANSRNIDIHYAKVHRTWPSVTVAETEHFQDKSVHDESSFKLTVTHSASGVIVTTSLYKEASVMMRRDYYEEKRALQFLFSRPDLDNRSARSGVEPMTNIWRMRNWNSLGCWFSAVFHLAPELSSARSSVILLKKKLFTVQGRRTLKLESHLVGKRRENHYSVLINHT